MRNVKRLLVLALAVLMMFSVAVFSASAAAEADYSDAAKRLTALNILKGDGSGNLMLENDVTRWQAALFFVQALTGETTAERWNAQKQSDVFTDVPEYGTAIDYAYTLRLIMGRGDGVYGYADKITYQDMLTMAVRALGYETEDMPGNYPHSYILAAEKLGLHEGIASDVTYTQTLKRGETAQIIWNMLDTEVAVTDPGTNKLLYPGESGTMEAITGAAIPRQKLLEKAGYSRDELRGTLVNYVEGDTASDIDTVDFEFSYTNAAGTHDAAVTLNAADLGITKRTVKDTFLGMPATLYIDAPVEEFLLRYDAEDEDCDVSVLFYDLAATTTVKALGDGTIKYTEGTTDSLVLDAAKFSLAKYDVRAFLLGSDGWEEQDTADAFLADFEYDTSDKAYTDTSSPYGEVRYLVLDKTLWGLEKDTLCVYYMPYRYAKYVVRSVYYRPTATAASFTLLAEYENTTITNMDGTNTHFVERFLGSGAILKEAEYYSVSEYDGKNSMTVKTVGETARNNDMVMYFYNELDNLLYVGKSYGPWKTGKLTGTNQSKETVKINGVEYGFGFEGGFDAGFSSDYATYKTNILGWIAEQDGANNVYYFPIGNNVVRLSDYNPKVEAVKHDFAVITTDTAVMAKTLGLTETKYENALIDGWYLDKNGLPQVAMLNKNTGAWQIISVGTYEYGEYDVDENEFEYSVDMAAMIELADSYGDFRNRDRYEAAKEALQTGGLLMIRKSASGVYTLSREVIGTETGDDAKAVCLERAQISGGLVFSDTAAKTNLIKSNPDAAVKPARVTLTASTVVVVIDKDGNVGVRKGIQKAAKSVGVDGYFYSATAKLIVFRVKNARFDVASWATGASTSTTEVYYVALGDFDAAPEKLDSGDYKVTLSNLFNLRTMKHIPTLDITIADSDTVDEDANAYSDIAAGTILHMTEDGELVVTDMSMEAALEETVQIREPNLYRYFKLVTAEDFRGIEFEDGDSITLPTERLDKETALNKISILVATLDLTGLDEADYDFNEIIIANKAYDDEENAAENWEASTTRIDRDGTRAYVFPMEGRNASTVITKPERGLFDMYLLDNMDGTFLVRDKNDDYFENAAEIEMQLCARSRYDTSTGTLIMYVVRTLTRVEG